MKTVKSILKYLGIIAVVSLVIFGITYPFENLAASLANGWSYWLIFSVILHIILFASSFNFEMRPMTWVGGTIKLLTIYIPTILATVISFAGLLHLWF